MLCKNIAVALLAMAAFLVAMPLRGASAVSDKNAVTDSVLLTTDTIVADSVPIVDSVFEKRGFFRKIADYFSRSNKYDPSKKMDFGIIGGPHYNSTTGLGLGIVASGLYSLDKTDSLLPLSNLSLFGDVTTSGFLMIGVKGNNVFKQRKYRFDYNIYVYTFPTKYWGIGYDSGSNDGNETSYSRFKFEVKPRFLFRLAENTYLGPMANMQYVNTSDFSNVEILDGDDTRFTTVGGGFSFMYDSRDVILNATKGWFVQLDQLFYPSFFGNKHVYHTTDLTVSTYHKAWKGAVIAGELHSQVNYNDVPWPMLASVGGPNRMRGYFEGRYRDKSIVEAQIELRQHIWKRHGAVLWFGAANVFPSVDAMRWRKTLLNGGVGYRWAFKQGVNVRLDLGMTKHGVGFVFNINEAF